MPFSEAQKKRFIGLLEPKGWLMRDGAVWSASSGLYFDDSHFGHWSPSDMREIFSRRAERIGKSQIGNWQIDSRENQEASSAAEAVIDI
jgi:hypothetical protein